MFEVIAQGETAGILPFFRAQRFKRGLKSFNWDGCTGQSREILSSCQFVLTVLKMQCLVGLHSIWNVSQFKISQLATEKMARWYANVRMPSILKVGIRREEPGKFFD